MIEEVIIHELLRITSLGNLFHREGQELEFKEQFNLAGLADYFKDFAAFSNNKGGYLIFGVTDAPRKLKGLTESSLEQFERIDPEKISGFLLEIFSGNISWEQGVIRFQEKFFGVFKISPASIKPIIAKKDEGKENTIKNGEVYYRYGGRTQKIQFPELESIINKRIEQNNLQWLDLMAKIGKAGPNNAAILDTEKSIIEKDDTKILVLDENLANKLKFIKEGEFVEKNGSNTLKLIGDVLPINKVEVIKKVKENLLKEYPISARELITEIKRYLPDCKEGLIYNIIKENGIKDNTDYAAYNFRNKKQEDEYTQAGKLPKGIPSIYNFKAVEFIIKLIKNIK
jgi:predicted HTH transcriptional regulator